MNKTKVFIYQTFPRHSVRTTSIVFKQALVVMVVFNAFVVLVFLKCDWVKLKRILPAITTSKGFAALKVRSGQGSDQGSDKRSDQSSDQGEQVIFSKCSIRRNNHLNCQKLFRTGKQQKSQYINYTEPEECSLKELIKDCPKLREAHGYGDKPVSEGELEFPIAFAIKMHKDSHQVERLLRAIHRPHNIYCIHVDSKSSKETYNIIKSVADCLPNVVVLSKRFNVVYTSYRVVMAELACMKHCMASDVKWKYYINLAGSELPLRTNLEIVEILKMFNGTNDIESYRFRHYDRHKLVHKVVGNEHIQTDVPLPKFKIPKIMFYKGSQYGMFSRDFVDFILTDDFVPPLGDWLSKTYDPDECFWSTLNMLPFAPGGYRGFNTDHKKDTHPSKAIMWGNDFEKCHGKYVHGNCNFATGDLPWLRTRPEVAANKFVEDYDSVVMDCMEEWVNNRTYSPSLEDFDWDYYLNLPQVKYSQQLQPDQKTKEYRKKQKEIWLKRNAAVQ